MNCYSYNYNNCTKNTKTVIPVKETIYGVFHIFPRASPGCVCFYTGVPFSLVTVLCIDRLLPELQGPWCPSCRYKYGPEPWPGLLIAQLRPSYHVSQDSTSPRPRPVLRGPYRAPLLAPGLLPYVFPKEPDPERRRSQPMTQHKVSLPSPWVLYLPPVDKGGWSTPLRTQCL